MSSDMKDTPIIDRKAIDRLRQLRAEIQNLREYGSERPNIFTKIRKRLTSIMKGTNK